MKKTIFFVVLFAIVIGSGLLISRSSNSDTNNSNSSSVETNSVETGAASVSTTDNLIASEGDQYVDYSASTLSSIDKEKRILFFKADWCPSCNALDRDIESNLSSIPENVAILKADYDSETELKKKYKVASQHTLVVLDENEEEVEKWSGILTLDDLLTATKS